MIDQLKQRLRDHIGLAEKATKGPWHIGNGEAIRIREQDESTVATVTHINLKGRRNIAEAEGNASFIASARTESPANARALLLAIEEIENAPHKPGCWSYYGDPCDCWKANALARIEEVMS